MTIAEPHENIRDLLIEEEMKGSYLRYAMSVIVSRALPDVRDGLKPSQRRILVAMNDLALGPRSSPRKCAKIAGDTSGNYHPHGESVVYPTLVRMAQPWNMRYPLVDGQGNFGSIDGDPPAAMRYTEAKLTAIAMELTEDLKLDTVDFVPTYDEKNEEPTVFPGKFPNLLCNGSAGIAVGMASSMPPHNLTEIVGALIAYMERPEITLPELLEIVPGPDFPTGGTICGRAGIVDAYRTGRGLITVRAKAHTEENRPSRLSIVFTEIPYQITKTRLIESIVDAVKGGRLDGISDVRDESDKDGLRLVIDLKRGEDDEVVLNQLYRHTPLQSTYSIINIALVGSRPRTLGLKELLRLYRDHRIDVIRRRTRFLLDKAERRAHILEGMLIALDRIDEVIETIRTSPDVPTARVRLVEKFGLSEIQADAILAMQLSKLTGLERDKLEAELAEKRALIEDYRAILGDDRRVLAIIVEDLEELREKYGDERRTEIIEGVGDIDYADLITEEDMVVTVSNAGYIKRVALTTYREQARGGKGKIGSGTKDDDFIEHLFVASTHDYILFFTDRGRVLWMKVYDLPSLGRHSRGRAIVNVLDIPKGDSIRSLFAVRDFSDGHVVMVTKNGVIKKTKLEAYSRPRSGGIIAIRIDDDDELIGVRHTVEGQQVVIATKDGKAIRFSEADVRSTGRATRGVRAITLRKGDHVVDFAVVQDDTSLLTVCKHGYGKRTDPGDYRLQKRGGMGVINIKTTKRNGPVVAMRSVLDEESLILSTQKGMIVRIPIETIRVIGRGTQGVRLMSLQDEHEIVAIATAPADEADEADEAGDSESEEVEGAASVEESGDSTEASDATGDEE